MPDPQHPPLTGLVWRLSMRWRTAIDRAIAPHGLTHAQYAVLAPLLGLERQGTPPSQRQLADLTGLEQLYISKLARALEQAGLLERTSHPDDTRAVQLHLTDRGREAATAAVRSVVGLQAELTATIGGPDSPRSRELAETLLLLLDPDSPTSPHADSPSTTTSTPRSSS